MGRIVLLLGVLLGLAVLVLQNLMVVVPLVVLGQPLVALPLGVWMGMAIAVGGLGNGVLMLLARPVSRRRLTEPELRPARPGGGRGSSSRRQVVESLAEEIWEDEQVSSEPERSPEEEWTAVASDAGGKGRRSPGRGRIAAEPEEALEDVIGGWNEPNRSQPGWEYEPEWDEEEAWTQPGTGVRRRSPRERQSPPHQEPRPASPSPSSPPAEARPVLKDFEKPRRPMEGQQKGSVYSYRYGRGEGDGPVDRPMSPPDTASARVGPENQEMGAEGESAGSERSEPLITPPPRSPAPPISTPPPASGDPGDDQKRSPSTVGSEATPSRAAEGPSSSLPKERTPLNLPPESEAPQSKAPKPRRSVMDAEYRVLRPPNPDYDERSPLQNRETADDDWDQGDRQGDDDDWDDWEDW